MKQDTDLIHGKQNKVHSLLLLLIVVIIITFTFINDNNPTIIIGLMSVEAFVVTKTFNRSSNRNIRYILFDTEHQQQQYQQQYSTIIKRTNTILYCICINCSRVIDCTAYHFVETKHEQPHMTLNPTFTPSDGNPTIHVNIRTKRSSISDIINRIRDEHNNETKHAIEEEAVDRSTSSSSTSAINQDNNNNEAIGGNNNNNINNLHGNTIYDVTPITTYEYDVVKCVDYIEDIGCWIRNMPEEIRIANPNFIPT